MNRQGSFADRPHISVILPTFQRRELVKRAIASVFAQTYRDFELIVIDDGSTDGTAEALAPLGDRLHYRWQENRGQSAARNRGVRLARGSIVAFLDDDDRWLPDHLAVLVELFARETEAVLVSTSPRHVIGGGAHPGKARLIEPLPAQIFANPVGWPSCVGVRRDAVMEVGGFDERLGAGEGEELWMRVAVRGGKFSLLQRRTIVRQYAQDGLMHTGRRRGHYLASFEIKADRAIAELKAFDDLRSSALLAKARGARRFAAALRALDAGDERATRTALEEAVLMLPELSQHSELLREVIRRFPRVHEPQERLRLSATLARNWPDQGCDTALEMRSDAILIAVRTGRARDAFRLVRGWPARRTPGFLVRTTPIFGRRVRRRIDAYLHHA